jgi:hypothetical protein
MIQRDTKESTRIWDSESGRERRRGVALEEKKVPEKRKEDEASKRMDGEQEERNTKILVDIPYVWAQTTPLVT